jgi:hypothetical protein
MYRSRQRWRAEEHAAAREQGEASVSAEQRTG